MKYLPMLPSKVFDMNLDATLAIYHLGIFTNKTKQNNAILGQRAAETE